MQARWGWAVGAAVVAGVVAVGVVAAIDDGPKPADAQETTTTAAPSGGTRRIDRWFGTAAHRDRHGRRNGVGHA